MRDLTTLPTDLAPTVTLDAPGTSVCPFDGGIDHWRAEVSYVPRGRLIEARSFYRFLDGFEEREITAEALANEILEGVERATLPLSASIRLTFKPAGDEDIRMTIWLESQ